MNQAVLSMVRFVPAMAIGVLLGLGPARAANVAGHHVPEQAEVAGQVLPLHGAAVRSVFVFDVDVVALYLAQRQASAEGVLAQPGPKRIRLLMLRDVAGADLQKHFMADFRAAANPAELPGLAPELAELAEWFRGPGVKKGDVLHLDWVPAVGLMASQNGRAIAARPMANERVFQIVLRMFVGPHAADRVRAGLLGPARVAQTAL